MEKLQKKHSFWTLYKKNIVLTSEIIGGFILIIAFYFSINPVLKFISSNPQLFYGLTIGAGAILVGYLLYFLCLWISKIRRQLYVPLSEKELELNSIKSIADYNAFLIRYFHGHSLKNKKIRNEITKSALLNLISSQEKEDLFNDWIDKQWIEDGYHSLTEFYENLPLHIQRFFGNSIVDWSTFYRILILKLENNEYDNIPKFEFIQNWGLKQLDSNDFTEYHSNATFMLDLSTLIFILLLLTSLYLMGFLPSTT